jgi:hypothetical protein
MVSLEFLIDTILPSASNRIEYQEYQEYFPEVKVAGE